MSIQGTDSNTGSQIRSFTSKKIIVMETRDGQNLMPDAAALLQVILKVKNLVSVLKATLIICK